MSFSHAPSQTSLGKHRRSIWCQTTLNPFLFLHHHHPPRCPHPFHGLTTSPTATTTHHHHRPPTTNSTPMPMTTATPGAMSLAVTTTRMAADDEERPRTTTPTNGNVAMPRHSPQQPPEQPQTTQKRRTTTKNHRSLLLLGHHGKYPPWFVSTHLAHTQHDDRPMTWDNNNDDNMAQQQLMTRLPHDDTVPTSNDETTRTRGDDMRLGDDNMCEDDHAGPGPPTNGNEVTTL